MVAGKVGTRLSQRRLILEQLRLRLLQVDLELTRIDLGQKLPFGHILALRDNRPRSDSRSNWGSTVTVATGETVPSSAKVSGMSPLVAWATLTTLRCGRHAHVTHA